MNKTTLNEVFVAIVALSLIGCGATKFVSNVEEAKEPPPVTTRETSGGPVEVVPPADLPNTTQPTGPTDPTTPAAVDAGNVENLPDDFFCDGGEPLSELDAGIFVDAGWDGGDVNPLLMIDAGISDNDCHWKNEKHTEKECCKHGHGWGDKNHCHLHKDK